MKELSVADRAERLLGLGAARAAAELDALPLEERLGLVLSLPAGKKRQELVLLSSRPAELVRAMAPEDFVLTIKSIGEADALALLENSSDEQTTYLADLELWREDRLDLGRLARWNDILGHCTPERFGRWLEALDFEILELLFERTLEPVDRERVPELPDRLSARLITPDHYHYFLAREGSDPQLLRKLVDFLFSAHRELFLALAGNLGTNPPAEVEEQALRWRQARLSERGWPDPREALDLYQPREPETAVAAAMPAGWENPPRYPLEPVFTGDLLAGAVDRLSQPAAVAGQLASLVNRMLLADRLPLAEPKSLRRAAARVGGHLNIGLRSLGASEPGAAAALIQKIPLLHLFQVAVHQIQRRVRRARQLARLGPEGWRQLLDQPLDAILDALLRPRPAFVPADRLEPREFERLEDLLVLDRHLDLVEAYARLSLAAGVRPAELPRPFPSGWQPDSVEGLSLSSLLLTAFARGRLGLQARPEPLPLRLLGRLLEALPPGEAARRELFHGWAAGLLDGESPGLDSLSSVLAELAGQLLSIPGERLDARFVGVLWLQD